MADKAYDLAAKSTGRISPPRLFRRHWKVFSEQEARQFYHPIDLGHNIELTNTKMPQT